MTYWMKQLGAYRRIMRHAHPDDPLLVVFDIDDTILDSRHAIVHVLASFDRHHGTRLFLDFRVDQVYGDETDLSSLIENLAISRQQGKQVLDWCTRYFWAPIAIMEGHVAFPGVMEVIGWLQGQPNTFVSLNTGRPESMRDSTLDCLNRLGKPYGATFSSELLFMRRTDTEISWIAISKVEGISHFQKLGYRVIAFLDNEPENLRAVEGLDTSGEILLMHAHTQFKSKPESLPERAVRGSSYHQNALIDSSHTLHKTLTLAL